MSNVIFEDRSTYDPAKDAVAICSLTVECAPGQMESVKAFMAGVMTQAGVYHVSFDSSVVTPTVEEPAAAPVAEPESAQADAAEPSSSVVAVADEQPALQEPESAATDTAAPVDEPAAAAPTGNSDEHEETHE